MLQDTSLHTHSVCHCCFYLPCPRFAPRAAAPSLPPSLRDSLPIACRTALAPFDDNSSPPRPTPTAPPGRESQKKPTLNTPPPPISRGTRVLSGWDGPAPCTLRLGPQPAIRNVRTAQLASHPRQCQPGTDASAVLPHSSAEMATAGDPHSLWALPLTPTHPSGPLGTQDTNPTVGHGLRGTALRTGSRGAPSMATATGDARRPRQDLPRRVSRPAATLSATLSAGTPLVVPRPLSSHRAAHGAAASPVISE